MATNRILTIVTNVGEYEKVGYRTGLWLGELTHFMDAVEKSAFRCDIASPKGGYVPIDPESLMLQELGHAVGLGGPVHNHYEDRTFMDRLKDTMRVADADVSGYDAIYLTGGHGVCFDFNNPDLANLTAKFWEAKKVVSAVCHGPAGLLEVKVGGEYLVKGKGVTGFSWAEEGLARREKAVPYNLEEELKKRGARYGKATLTLVSHVVEDGLLITGQNPASAAAVGEAVAKKLKA
ncbi:type 1 glutamine amidotransferase domain-containing protein [bacterium]|nr:type 1 glutamine amidotransferase domain-containing protein [bacterium]